MALVSVNPADDRILAEHPELDDTALRAALDQSHAAFLAWRRTTFAERASRMRATAALLRSGAARYAS
ncbi:MAG: aldehyde dehydrogenase family protein, partial [Fibrobacteria bacterium]